MTQKRQELLQALARVDWIRAGQRLLVFCREVRGDDPEAINQDHASALERAQRLRGSIEGLAQQFIQPQPAAAPKRGKRS